MIDQAAKTGADAIKFQTFITEETVSPSAPFAEHHIANVKDIKSHFKLLKRLELPLDVFLRLKKHAERAGIIFISTPYDIISVKYLASIKVPAIKIASAEIINTPLIDAAIDTGLPIILSTGMNNLDTVTKVGRKILKSGADLALLKCTSNYPVDYLNINLNGISTLKK
ncbi:MAG: N-acetylneuraminate synthase family protein, partial [Candidatus Omnitrophica bacterium]|nr:N-acetylneuraminate synthase family protein [Candidatus Omnitrophota bacterium]